eukprot:1180594-Prorocentrum_minimum.AAC.4
MARSSRLLVVLADRQQPSPILPPEHLLQTYRTIQLNVLAMLRTSRASQAGLSRGNTFRSRLCPYTHVRRRRGIHSMCTHAKRSEGRRTAWRQGKAVGETKQPGSRAVGCEPDEAPPHCVCATPTVGTEPNGEAMMRARAIEGRSGGA